jgi:hypothetical protein
MKQFQMMVSIPPEEVIRRLASAIAKPGLGLALPFGGKNFFGTINGLTFQFRSRRRFSRNNFAPGCFGNIQPNGYGSAINAQIGQKNTLFVIFAIVFVVLVTFVSGSFGVIVLGASLANNMGPAGVGVAILLFMIPLLAIGFLLGLFMIGKWMGKSDEARMTELLYYLFADVAVR